MSKFESSIQQVPYSQEAVYRNISDMSNLEKVRHRVPEDKVKDFHFDQDSVSVNVPPVGEIRLRIINREEPKCVKFETEQSPLHGNQQQAEGDGRCRHPLHAERHGERSAQGRSGEDCPGTGHDSL